MKIKIKMYSILQKYAPDKRDEFVLTVEQGTTAKTVPKILNIPETLKYKLFINGGFCDLETVLQAGDEITLFPLMDGG